MDHATQLILRVCEIAGLASFVDDARRWLKTEGIDAAVRKRDTAVLFDWLVAALSYQGIADQVAQDFMDRYGNATWAVIASDLRRQPSCLFTTAATTRPGTPVPNPPTWRGARCLTIGCATVA
jgi:hypothetical protein